MGQQLDDFGQNTAWRVHLARKHHDGHPSGAWSTREQLAVALVLSDKEHLDHMGYTRQEAVQCVRDGMHNPPSDVAAWIGAVAAAAFDVEGQR